MIIQCEACKTKFRVGDDKVKPPGIKVRCSKCGEVFFFEYSLHEEQVQEEVAASPFAEETPQQPEIPQAESKAKDELPDIPVDDTPDEVPETISFDTTAPETDELISSEDPEPPEDVKFEIDNQEPTVENPVENIEIDKPPDLEEKTESSFINLEIDHLDDMAESQGVSKDTNLENDFKTPDISETKTVSEPPPPERQQSEFQTPNLSLDQDVLEQTYTKGTVASSADVQEPAYAAAKKSPAVRRYPRGRRSGSGFFRKFLTWIFSIILIGTLFLVSMFLLNETKIYPNDYFSRFDSFASKYYGGDGRGDLKNSVRIRGDKGSWFSSKYGQVYVVSGEAVNTSNTPINYLKLRVYYVSDGTNIFIQELYAGNTLSKREIKNNSFNSLQAKLNRKNGDISYDDANNLDGLNFDIQPGEIIPFYSIFPAKEKILGLKYRVEVVDFDSAEITENP